MKVLIAVLGTIGLGAIILVVLILARLTQRWELVTRSKSAYRFFYVAAALVAVAALTRLIRISYLAPASDVGTGSTISVLYEPQSWFYLCFYHLPLTIGLAISLALVWHNWGWLLRENRG